MDGSSSLKVVLALAGERFSERQTKRFEEGLLKSNSLQNIWQGINFAWGG